MYKKVSTEEFINKVKEIHNNYYDYFLINYINKNSHVDIICPIHGIFKQLLSVHSVGGGCKKCGILKVKKALSHNLDILINKANIIHKGISIVRES